MFDRLCFLVFLNYVFCAIDAGDVGTDGQVVTRDTDILHGQDVENLCHSHAGILGVTAVWKAGS